jgi:ActR/RegA family two-component response regulator
MGGSVRCHPCIENKSTEGVVSISEADIGSPRFRIDWDDIHRINPGKLRILVADDEENARDNVQRILIEDFDVVLCDSIDKAIARAKEQTFFGAVLDVNFKEKNRDGIYLAKILKEIDLGIRIVVVSGQDSHLGDNDDWRVRADRAGARKSFDKANYKSADLLKEFK